MTTLVPTVLPLNNSIEQSEWTLLSAATTFVPSYAWGPSSVVRYGVDRWQAKFIYRGLSQADRHLLARFLAAVGKYRPFWVYDPSHNVRGSWNGTELLSSPESASFWTGGTGRTVTSESGGVRATRSSATDSSYIASASAISVTANSNYALRAVAEEGGADTYQAGLACGSTGGGTTYGTVARSSPLGRRSLACIPTLSTCYVSLLDNLTVNANWATWSASLMWRGVSFQRCGLTSGGTGALTQVGSRLYTKGWGQASTTGLLKAGSMVELITPAWSQLLRLTEDLNTDSSNNAIMCFEPQLRAAVSSDCMIVPVKPMVLMMLTEDTPMVTRPGWYSDIELNCVEVF